MVGNPYYANHGAGNPNVKEQFDIISFSGDFLPPLSFQEDHRLAPWRIQHNLRTATIIEQLRYPMMPTVFDFNLSHASFYRL
jgi:hypothetical protein